MCSVPFRLLGCANIWPEFNLFQYRQSAYIGAELRRASVFPFWFYIIIFFCLLSFTPLSLLGKLLPFCYAFIRSSALNFSLFPISGKRHNLLLVCFFLKECELRLSIFILLPGRVDTTSLCCAKWAWPSGGAAAGTGCPLAGKDQGESLWVRWHPRTLKALWVVSLLKTKAPVKLTECAKNKK